MPRKRKKKRRREGPKTGRDPAYPFNPALDEPVFIKPEGDVNTAKDKVQAGPTKKWHPASEDDYFMEAMRDVAPLSEDRGRVTTRPKRDLRPPYPPGQGDLEVLAHLSELVSGVADMDVTFSDEYMEGAIQGIDRKLMEKLRKGEFPVQDYVDLHGMTREEAELSVRNFLMDSYRHGLRCVLLVHGRGLNSEDHIPVLKRRVPVWLSRSPVKKIILAFSTARPYDGGTGAIYVLLRKSGKMM
ncbi:MAG: Smr/MutS family protein [Deltaproteobacteria bacterium]|nr:Smr/MutS family protein [Deltaproteobacteria bacterium]